MNFMAKLRLGSTQPVMSRALQARDPRAPITPLHAPAGVPSGESEPRPTRFSNGLKEFLWQLDGINQGTLADFGSVSQATVTYFIERGFKVYTEDLLAGWGAFLQREAERATLLPPETQPETTAAAQAERFLSSNLRYPPNSFDAALLWDVLDYLDRDIARLFVERILSLMREGGAILAIFHTRTPEQFHRYRVLDAQNLELVSAAPLVSPQRTYQNREIQVLFERFRSSKTFVGRDQLREGVFLK
jgi:hypothetical protein